MNPEDSVKDQVLLDILYRISRLVSQQDDPNLALVQILDEIVKAFGASSASIGLINPDSNRLEIEVARGLPKFAQELQLPLGHGVTGWVALHGKPLLVPDVQKDHRYFPVKDSIKSEMAAPMLDQGVVIGVVNVDSEKVNAFGPGDLKALTLLTSEASRVVSRLWLIDQLKVKATQLESLINTATNLVSKLEPGELLDNITEEGQRIMKCRLCALFLVDAADSRLVLRSVSGEFEGVGNLRENLSLRESSLGTAFSRRKQIEIHDLTKAEDHHFSAVIRENGLISLLSSPIIFENEVIGVLNAYTDHLHRFNNEEKRIFATLASLGAVAIQNARLYARIFDNEEKLRKDEKLTMLGLLAAEIAHEIRNPLMVIKLLFDSLELEFPDADARNKDISVIGDKLKQLEGIVSRVLEFGRSNVTFHARWRLHSLIQDTYHLVRIKLQQGKIHYTLEQPEEKLYVSGIKDQLQQVFLNLILNAVQAMPDGGDLTINLFRQDMKNIPMAVVEISDTGSGIGDSMKNRIFDSFLTGRKEGTGLGLSIVKRILKGHRGDIELAQTSKSGTTFRIWLPIAHKS